jgi:aspartate racemase
VTATASDPQATAGRSLSFAQERLWFLEQLNRGQPLYSSARRLRLHGRLDEDALARALAAVVARHEILRTSFRTVDGRPVQRVDDAVDPPLPVSDASSVPVARREAEAERLAREHASRPLRLDEPPLLCARLLRLDSELHELVLTTHDLVADRRSFGVLGHELAALYNAFSQAGDPQLPTLALQYADYAEWQRGALRGKRLDRLLAYWREQLHDPPTLDLPSDRPRPAKRAGTGATVLRQLSNRAAAAVATLGGNDRPSSLAVLVAAFHALLHRYSGQEDVVVGTASANRGRAEIEPLIGFFVNMLPLRARLAADIPFAELLDRVRDAVRGAHTHQELPFELLVETLNPSRDPSRTPVFQVALTLDDEPAPPAFDGLETVVWEPLPIGTARYDLTLDVRRSGDSGLAVAAEFSTELFEPGTVERLLGHYEVLLTAAADRPQSPIGRLPLLPERERAALLRRHKARPYPADSTLSARFQAQAERTPNRPAVSHHGHQLSYRQLNQHANQLAHHLQAHGVGRETLVALCLERSLHLPTAVLAILKAGGAYVPLDPNYPPDRLRYMLTDTNAPLLLTQPQLQPNLPPHPHTILLDPTTPTLNPDLDHHPTHNPPNPNQPTDLAYIVYTSGSTGRPKGVETTHRGVLRLVVNNDFLAFEGESFLQISPLSFDGSTLEIFGPLLNGGRVVMLPPGMPTPAGVVRCVEEEGVTTLWLIAPLFHLTVDTHLEDLRGVRQLMAGGDVLSIPHVKRALAGLPGTRLVDGYGPTEVTAFTSTFWIREVDDDWPSIPIGRPIGNTRVYVVDRNFEPVPTGVPGELLIGGPGVARGYHNRPDLTAERFVPDPFTDAPGQRLYRTGDLVRWLPDGNLQFLSRIDTQVKIDGIRVELGEVQDVLASHPDVRAAVVVAREQPNGRRVLLAYVVPERPVEAEALRAFARQRLPGVMVPSAFVTLGALPTTPNGKVDYRALPEPEAGGRHGEGAEPATETERILVDVFSRVLGVEGVGVHDDFFELGGHSLRAVQVISAIGAEFGVDLPVQEMFERPTPSALAVRVEEAMLEGAGADLLERLVAEVGGRGG